MIYYKSLVSTLMFGIVCFFRHF